MPCITWFVLTQSRLWVLLVSGNETSSKVPLNLPAESLIWNTMALDWMILTHSLRRRRSLQMAQSCSSLPVDAIQTEEVSNEIHD
jgi:hypothetical protein